MHPQWNSKMVPGGGLGGVVLVGVVCFVGGIAVALRHPTGRPAPTLQGPSYEQLRSVLSDTMDHNSRLDRALTEANAKLSQATSRELLAHSAPESRAAERDGAREPSLASVVRRDAFRVSMQAPRREFRRTEPEQRELATLYKTRHEQAFSTAEHHEAARLRNDLTLASDHVDTAPPMTYPWQFEPRFQTSERNMTDAVSRMRRLIDHVRALEAAWERAKFGGDRFELTLVAAEQGIRDTEQTIRDSEQTMRDLDQSIMDSKNHWDGSDLRAMEANERDREAAQRDVEARERDRQADTLFAEIGPAGYGGTAGPVAQRLYDAEKVVSESADRMEKALKATEAFERGWQTSNPDRSRFEASVRLSEGTTERCESSTGAAEHLIDGLESELRDGGLPGRLASDSVWRSQDAQRREADVQVRVADAERRIDDTRKPVPSQYRLEV